MGGSEEEREEGGGRMRETRSTETSLSYKINKVVTRVIDGDKETHQSTF